MPLSVRQPEESENVSQAPTLGGFGGVVTGQTGGQRGRGTVSGRGSGFTNLQSYIRANESNPNAQLIQQRAGQATQAQRQAQTGFETQAGQARGQLEGIQSQAGLVSSALQDPTKFVSTPENLQRITALRTGQEAIANPTAIQQNVLQGAEGLQSQRGMIGQALQRDVTGTGLQEYLRSQRVNPALATAGENRLDRFLAEQTTSGQQAIGGAMTEAQRIAALNQPEQVGQIGELVSQVQANPLATREGILNALTARQKEEEGNLTNLNLRRAKDLIANQVNIPDSENADVALSELNQDISGIQRAINFSNAQKQKLNELNSYVNSGIANIPDKYGDLKQTFENIEGTLISDSRAGNANWINSERRRLRQAAIDNYNPPDLDRGMALYRGDIVLNQLLNDPRNQALKQYESSVNKLGTRLDFLQQYDPSQLARLRALEQITGGSFNPLLSGRIA